MVGCCKKIELLKDLFDEYYSEESDMDNIDMLIEIERILEL